MLAIDLITLINYLVMTTTTMLLPQLMLVHLLLMIMKVITSMTIQLMLFEILIIIGIIIPKIIREATAMQDLINHTINNLSEEIVMHEMVSTIMLEIFNF